MANQFQTVSTATKNVRTILLTWTVVAIIAVFAITISVATLIFFEAIIAISFLLSLYLVSKTKWVLVFEDDKLAIFNTGNKRGYSFEDLKKADFIIKQTDAQKAKNCGDLKIVGSSAVFNDVQNVSELSAYINENFK